MNVGGRPSVVLGERLLRFGLVWAASWRQGGKWLWLHGRGHLSVEDRAVVVEMGESGVHE